MATALFGIAFEVPAQDASTGEIPWNVAIGSDCAFPGDPDTNAEIVVVSRKATF